MNLKQEKIFIESIKVKKSDGSEVMRPIRPSNLMITTVNLDDKSRVKVLNRAGKKAGKEHKAEHKKEHREEKPAEKKEEVKKKETKK